MRLSYLLFSLLAASPQSSLRLIRSDDSVPVPVSADDTAEETDGLPPPPPGEEAPLVVKVTEGPTECEDALRIQVGSYATLAYKGVIHESSYSGTPGDEFENTVDMDELPQIQLGAEQVLKGWDQGLVGKCQGAHVTLIVPPSLGYGMYGVDDATVVPPYATLYFEIHVVEVMEGLPAHAMNMFDDIDEDESGNLTLEEVTAFFAKSDQPVTEGLWEQEDKNLDGVITWEEFTGPKGKPPKVVIPANVTSPTGEATDGKDEL